MKRTEDLIFEFRPYKKIELRNMIGRNKYYFNKLIEKNKAELGEIESTLLSIEQVKLLVLKAGIPYKVRLE